MGERSEWGSSFLLPKEWRSFERWKKVVATGGNFSCKNSTVDMPRLNNETAAGILKEEGDDERKTKAEKMKSKKVKMTDQQSDSGSGTSWLVQAISETLEEVEV